MIRVNLLEKKKDETKLKLDINTSILLHLDYMCSLNVRLLVYMYILIQCFEQVTHKLKYKRL